VRTHVLIVLAALLGCRGDGSPKAEPAPTAAPAAPSAAAGHALLGRYVAALRGLASSGDPAPVIAAITAEETEIRSLADKGAVAPELRDRTLRLLGVTRGLLAPATDDAARQATKARLDELVHAVRGPNESLPVEGGLSVIAPVLTEEVLNLHMLLDGSTDRDQTRARYMQP
jgi:hypothetical protein